MHKLLARSIRTCFVVVLAVAAGLLVAPSPALAVSLPGGRANYVVGLGHLDADSRTNWVRLGTYEFTADGRVTARLWLWSQANPTARVGTGTSPDSSCSTLAGVSTSKVRTCEVRTAGGFTAAPAETRTGTFTTFTVDVGGAATEVVNIRWAVSRAWSEEWYVRPSADLARFDFKYNTRATHGYGYGSDAALSTRRAMSSVRSFPGTLKQDLVSWSHDNVGTSSGQTFQHTRFSTCDTVTWCLTYLQPSSANACQASGGCPNYGGGTDYGDSSIQYYVVKLSSHDRRDTLWHWCTCLAREQGTFCYTGNSHVKPMLQVIDDAGNFRGWVGVEASFYPYSGGDPRSRDMISVFRISDFR